MIYKDGVLQEFIEPCEDFNNEYLVNWSERLITIERVVNKKHFTDKKSDIYEKYCVLPHITNWCSTSNISSNLLKCVFSNVTNIMSEVISCKKHIISFFNGSIGLQFMNLVFKIGKNKKVYFLYCRRLICRSAEPQETEAVKTQIAQEYQNAALDKFPNFVMNSTAVIRHQSTDIRKNLKCQLCRVLISKAETCGLKIKYLLEHIDLDPKDNRLKVNVDNDMGVKDVENSARANVLEDRYDIVHFRPQDVKNPDMIRLMKAEKKNIDCVPPQIEILFPKMTKKEFVHLRGKASFQQILLSVCDACYLKYSDMKPFQEQLNSKPLVQKKISIKATKISSQDKSVKVKYINQVRFYNSELCCKPKYQVG
jgi:hypothetical protein